MEWHRYELATSSRNSDSLSGTDRLSFALKRRCSKGEIHHIAQWRTKVIPVFRPNLLWEDAMT